MLALHRERTGTTNQIHTFLLEFGISLPRGIATIKRLPAVLAVNMRRPLPARLRAVLERLRVHFRGNAPVILPFLAIADSSGHCNTLLIHD